MAYLERVLSENMARKQETKVAQLVRREDGTLEVRFKPGATLTPETLAEVLEARQTLCGAGGYPVLVVLPSDFDFDISAVTRDHYAGRGLEECTYAVAWDVGSALGKELVEMFYRYFPQPFPVQVFRSEGEADEWLEDQKGT